MPTYPILMLNSKVNILPKQREFFLSFWTESAVSWLWIPYASLEYKAQGRTGILSMIIRVVPLSILSVQLASRCTSLKYCSQRNLSRYRTSKKHWSDRTGFIMESVILQVMWSLLQLFSILSLTSFNTSGDLVSDWPQWGSLSPAWKHPYRPGANLSSSPLRAGLSTQAIIHPHNGSLVYYHQHQPGSLEKTGRKGGEKGLD